MLNNSIPPFYVGQRVVALITTNLPLSYFSGNIIKDEIYVIKAIQPGCCELHSWDLDVGITYVPGTVCLQCEKCQGVKRDGIFWAVHTAFAPIIEGYQKISFSKVQELEEVCVN